jgi:hypothetical protein
MKLMWLLFAALLVSSVCLPVVYAQYQTKTDTSNEDFYFGVTFGGNTTSEAKLLIDKVKGYTNLFVIDSWDMSGAPNETALNEICDYAAEANLNIIVYFSFIFYNYTFQFGNGTLYNATSWDQFGYSPWHISWMNEARERWGNKFLGVYLYDEPGGKQIDTGYYGGNMMTFAGTNITTFRNVANYTDAANRYVRSISSSGSMQHVINSNISNSVNSPMPVFTADNALYWFDYLSGYDAVFAELGWNHNQAQHVALCRGAANVQNKDWGAIITWATNDPPYLARGAEMSQDMLTAYRAGAKYIIVFNYPQINPYGALTEEHFTAMKQFWTYIHCFPREVIGKVKGKVALVLPKDYGWGMRQPNDNIWGFWPPDDIAPQIGRNIYKLINEYGLKLDIIYDDSQFNFTEKYSKIYFWNDTINLPSESVSSMLPPYELYVAIVTVAIAITCVATYLIVRRRKRRSVEAGPAGSAAKARLINSGSGKLELTDNTIKFYIKKGHLKKREKVAREIPITDIESVKQVGNVLSITWKGVTDMFVIEKSELVGKINEKVAEAFNEKEKILENDETAKQKRNELTMMLSVGIKIVDSLFDMLRSLQGRIDWNHVEDYLARSEENARNFAALTTDTVNLEFAKLSLAVTEHLPGDISKEIYSSLKSLFEYFNASTSKDEPPEQTHPNYHDAKTIILAYYTLNDFMLGTIVGDEETGKEGKALATMLEDLSNVANVKINVDAVKDIINKLGVDKESETVIEESRAVFKEQLKELISHERSNIEPFPIQQPSPP